MDTVFDLIEPFDKCIKSLREARRKQIDEFQRECCHPTEHLVEGEYLPLNYCSIPPVRVCKRCGVAEEGWQVHKILPSSEPVANPYLPTPEFRRRKHSESHLDFDRRRGLIFP